MLKLFVVVGVLESVLVVLSVRFVGSVFVVIVKV